MTTFDPSRSVDAPPENTGAHQSKGRFVKGRSGNPCGKPKGTRNRTTRLLDELAADAGEQIVRDLIARAGRSDAAAAAVLARIWPVPRGRAVTFKLPEITNTADAARAVAAILKSAAQGEMTPEEAATFVAIAERYARLLEISDLEKRIVALERATDQDVMGGSDAGPL